MAWTITGSSGSTAEVETDEEAGAVVWQMTQDGEDATRRGDR